jgi:hypothetical protein
MELSLHTVVRRQDWRSTAVKGLPGADLPERQTNLPRNHGGEGPVAVIPSAPEETPGWRTAARVLRLS